MDAETVRRLPVRITAESDLVEALGANGPYAATVNTICSSSGTSGAYSKTATGTNTLLAAVNRPRFVLITVSTTEAIADAGGTKSAFTIGEQDASATKFVAAANIGTTLGDVRVFSGTLSADKKLEVYATAALSTGTGAIGVAVIAVRALGVQI